MQYSQNINDTRLHPKRKPTGTNVITHNFLGTEFTAQTTTYGTCNTTRYTTNYCVTSINYTDKT